MKSVFLRVALALERFVDRFRRARSGRCIEPFIGYADGDDLILRGRVLSEPIEIKEGRGVLGRFLGMARLFRTKEVSGVEVLARGVTATSDEEGYFTLRVPRFADDGGCAKCEVFIPAGAGPVPGGLPHVWHEDMLAQAVVQVHLPDPKATCLIVSDIDDTLIRTGAWSLWRNLWTSLTGSVSTREVFPDAVDLMRAVSDGGRNPVFYVSSSPWNLHGFLVRVFEKAGLVPGPLFLRDYGVAEGKLVADSPGSHKGAAIDRILAAVPDLPAILIGDTGQKDASVYLDVVLRHPGRVSWVILRQAGHADQAESIASIREAGVPVDVVADYRGVLAKDTCPG